MTTRRSSSSSNTGLLNTQHEDDRNDQLLSQPSSEVHTGSISVITHWFPDDLPKSLDSIRKYIIENMGILFTPTFDIITQNTDALLTTWVRRNNDERTSWLRSIHQSYVMVILQHDQNEK